MLVDICSTCKQRLAVCGDTCQSCEEVDVIAGNITFFQQDLDGKFEAHVQNFTTLKCTVRDLDDFCEALLENYEGYLVPSEYRGKIIYL